MLGKKNPNFITIFSFICTIQKKHKKINLHLLILFVRYINVLHVNT